MRKTILVSFLDSFLSGFGSSVLFFTGTTTSPRAPKEDICDDWKAVGRDLAVAMRRCDACPERGNAQKGAQHLLVRDP
jgi:hypothetical protein